LQHKSNQKSASNDNLKSNLCAISNLFTLSPPSKRANNN
jgi:hypothetical protein